MGTPTSVQKTIDDYALNVSLFAYDHNIEDRVREQFLAYIGDPKRNSNIEAEKDVVVPLIKPTDNERSIDGAERYGLWVGMRPSTAKTYTTIKDQGKQNKGKSINTFSSGGYVTIMTDPDALRVVVPEGGQTASYYVLTRPHKDDPLVALNKDDLCVAYKTIVDEVFFFPEYWTREQTDAGKRKTEWGQKVLALTKRSQTVKYDSRPDKTVFETTPNRALANGLTSFVGMYLKTPNKDIARSAIALIDNVDIEGAFIPPPTNTALVKMIDLEAQMTENDYALAHSELVTLVPALAAPLAVDLKEIREAIVNSKIVLPYTNLRWFIVLFLNEVEHCLHEEVPMEDIDFNDLASRVMELIQRGKGGKATIMGQDTTQDQHIGAATSVEQHENLDGVRLILKSEMAQIEFYQKFLHLSLTGLKNSQGGSIVATTPTYAQLWTKYGQSPDLDTAKLFATGIHNYSLDATSTKVLGPLQTMFEEHAERLRKLHDSIPVEDTDQMEHDG